MEILKVCRHSFNTDFYIFSPAQIEAKKAEAKRSLCEAGICRAQADTAAMRGTTSRSLGQPHRSMLETAERKIYEARTKEQEASLLETEVTSHLITVSTPTNRKTFEVAYSGGTDGYIHTHYSVTKLGNYMSCCMQITDPFLLLVLPRNISFQWRELGRLINRLCNEMIETAQKRLEL